TTLRRFWPLLLIAALIGFAVMAPVPAMLSQPGKHGLQAIRPNAQRRVTLVTGDSVDVYGWPAGPAQVRIDQAGGRKRTDFRIYQQGQRLYVIPLEVQPIISAGRVDYRFFDVNELIAVGYDDGRRSSLPMVVRYREKRWLSTVRFAMITEARPR